MVAKGIGVVSIETLTRQGIKVQSESPQAKGLQKLIMKLGYDKAIYKYCLLYTSPSPRDVP